jgi:hypothetical protein
MYSTKINMPIALETSVKPKRVIETPNRVCTPLASIESRLTPYSNDTISKSIDSGLIKVAQSNEQWQGQRLEYQQATFVNGMLDKLFSLPGGLAHLKAELAKPMILEGEKKVIMESPGSKVFKKIKSRVLESLRSNKEVIHNNCSIQAQELSIPEITTILAAYMEEAALTEVESNGFKNSYYTRNIPTANIDDIVVKDLSMRIRNTPSDLRGHEGGPGHVHLEMSFTKSTPQQKVSINIHIYPNLKPFSKSL